MAGPDYGHPSQVWIISDHAVGGQTRPGATAMARRPHVALMVETSSIFGRRILEGIAGYLRARAQGSWSVFVEQRALDSVPPRWLETWRGDGIISRVSSPAFADAVRRARVAAVDLTHRRPPFGLPRIVSDDDAIGR